LSYCQAHPNLEGEIPFQGVGLSHPKFQISKIFQDNAFTKNLLGLHGVAYDIFLKSLRSLEEFMKNPQIKIPLKCPCTNFQSLGKFKNSIFIPKMFPLQISAKSAQLPAGLYSIWPSWPYWPNSAQSLTHTLPPAKTSAAPSRSRIAAPPLLRPPWLPFPVAPVLPSPFTPWSSPPP
jgi:hypothetical protein